MCRFRLILAYALISINISGCASDGKPENTTRLQQPPEEDTSLIDERVALFFKQNPHYAQIAKSTLSQSFLANRSVLNSQRSRLLGLNQTRLPQVTPTASLDQNGNPVGRLVFEQTLFDNGRFRAQKAALKAGEADALAQSRIEANEKVASAFVQYFSACEARDQATLAEGRVAFYREFLRMANLRSVGGVGKRSEINLFELKLAQAKLEKDQYRADEVRLRSEFEALAGIPFPDKLNNRFNFANLIDAGMSNTIKLAPGYKSAEANVEAAIATLKEQKSQRRPALTLTGSFGEGTALGAGANDRINDVRLGLSASQPINWGRNHNLEALESEIEAAQLQLLDVERETKLEALDLMSQIKSQVGKFQEHKNVADLARRRANSFQEDFRNGAVSFSEAVSILETLRSVENGLVRVEYAILTAEMQLAELFGLLSVTSASGLDASSDPYTLTSSTSEG